MKVIGIDDKYVLYPDSLKTYESLPAQCYVVSFNKLEGFSLVRHEPLTVNEKVYGDHKPKVDKILRAFSKSERSIGAIASGKKGIGKSLLFRMLAEECIKAGIPVIIVDKYYPGISNYIDGIRQEVMVLFDEFDKTFAGVKQMEGASDAQAELLGLFDGISNGKKLFAITCNEIYNISDFLVNRPGRFHYHFRFDEPSADEIKQYIYDKLGTDEWVKEQANEIVKFSRKVPLNYDCLRAIVFELEMREPFKDAIKDLNIVKSRNTQSYDMMLKFTDGTKLTSRDKTLDMFSDEDVTYWFENEDGDAPIRVTFSVNDAKYDMGTSSYRVDAKDMNIYKETQYTDEAVINEFKDKVPDYITIKMNASKNIHYLI